LSHNTTHQLLQLIDDLGLKAMTIEPTDVGGMGELLEDLEVIKSFAPSGTDLISIVKALVNTIEAVIMDQDKDTSVLMTHFLDGISLLQNTAKLAPGEVLGGDGFQVFIKKLEEAGIQLELDKAIQFSDTEANDQPEAENNSMNKNIIVDKDLCYEFITETIGNFDEVENTLIQLEDDPTNKELLNAVFRFFHTAKGVSGFLNLQRLNHFAHELENLLDGLRNDRLKLTPSLTDFILRSMDFFKIMLAEIKRNLDQNELQEPYYDVESRIKEMAPFLKSDAEEDISNGEAEGTPIGEILIDMGKASPEDIGGAIARQLAGHSDQKIGDILTSEGKISTDDVQEALRKQAGGIVQDKDVTVKVSTAKLDNVVDMVGELVIAESLVFQNPLVQASNDQKLFKDFSQLHRITSDLQKTAMSMRMVAIKQTFQKMVRLVRDLARKAGKEVDLHMIGEETEIDRRMVDEISDPLIHMVRNAVDHGLEVPEARKAEGKDLKGNIYLRAYHQGGHLFIEIRDDGRGMNREKIYRKALEKGIIRANENLTDKEIYNLIFLPGFSTADQITEISGRGVGMDVVKKFIDKMRGGVEIDSKPGEGTLFIMKLPLTLAIIDGILVQVGSERYILPTVTVKESFQPREDQFYTVAKKGEVVTIRGKILPLIRLYQILDIPAAKNKPHEGIIVVVEYEDEELCFLIDDLVGKQEVVIKSLGSQFKKTKGFSGGAILGDGRIGLILDVKGIVEVYRETVECSDMNIDVMALSSRADAGEMHGDIG
jgi:two-component system, chemotaxis family, sensor kinase CheA